MDIGRLKDVENRWNAATGYGSPSIERARTRLVYDACPHAHQRI